MNKKIISLFITLSLLLGVFSTSFAATTTADERVTHLLRIGIIRGYEDGTLRLEKPITRAEFSSILAKMIVDGEEEIEKYKEYSHFLDIDKDNWATPYVNILFDKGIVTGYGDSTYKPNNEINFNEVITMIIRSLDIQVETEKTWAEGYIKKAKELGILDNVKVTDYLKSANRQNIVDLIYNTLELRD